MGLSTAVGDEGGFVFAGGTEDALDTIKLSVENAGYTFGDEIMIAFVLQLSFVKWQV
jgi:enolase